MSDSITSAAPASPAAANPAPTPAANAAPADNIDLDSISPEEQAELDAEAAVESKKASTVPSKTKLKVDGEEVELTEEEIKKYASLGKAAQKRMQEAATIRKQHEKLQADVNVFLEMLQKNPEKVLSDLGIDPDKFAEERINRRIENEAKTPEQKEKEELQKKLEEAQKRIEETENAKKREESERIQNEVAMKMERDINEAIDSGDMPKNPYMVRKVADLLLLAAAQNIDLEAKDVIPMAKKQVIEEFRSLTGVLPEELLEEILGTDKVASLRRRYLKKLKATPATPKDIKQTGQSDRTASVEKPKEKISAKDFFKKIGTF